MLRRWAGRVGHKNQSGGAHACIADALPDQTHASLPDKEEAKAAFHPESIEARPRLDGRQN
jgi:hypothetical protein